MFGSEYDSDKYEDYIRGSERSYDSSPGDEPTIRAARVDNEEALGSPDELDDLLIDPP